MIKWIRFLLTLAIATGCLAWVLRSLDWSAFHGLMVRVQWTWVLAGIGCFFLSLGVRAVRWWRCVAVLVPGTRIGSVLGPLYVGYLLNMVLPGKLGELAKLVTLSRKTRVSSVQATVSILMDRLADGLGLSGVMGMALVLGHWYPAPTWVWVAGMAFFGWVAVAVVGVAYWAPLRTPALWIADRCGLSSARAILLNGLEALRQLTTRRLWAELLTLSVLNWIAEAGLFVLITKGVTGDWLVGPSILMMGMTSFGGIVLATPAGIGSHEFLVLKGAVACGLLPTVGIAIGVLTHVVLVVPTGLGGAFVLLTDAGKYLKNIKPPVS